MDWVDKAQNFKGLYGNLEVLHGSNLDCFRLTALKTRLPSFSFSKILVDMFKF